MITTRRAHPDDAATAATLLHAFNTEFDAPVPDVPTLTTRFAELLRRDDILIWFAIDGDRPFGFALVTLRPSVYFDGPLAQLEELYVEPQSRGRGAGQQMVAAMTAELVRRDHGEIHINVDEVDDGARRFYERHGFTNFESNGSRMLCYVRDVITTA
ncbi:GNAT family N-acetyltransferase [Williamsia sterculiae]|uniref:Ribosomal protein S18 acetylase RimI n=1 Tax=Williamsia sterculiae TaxID=1344003 RepID=A0A1N7H283_9NOCA|nr:GNAT family N-acetyltransferase [Williamsia sterculiae]SIS18926.1 Ribosomal protein S18 acetylase RimI [Williamsia sterculiae]